MQHKRLNLYNLDPAYIALLTAVDNNVMSVSPQTHKETRPFVGVVVPCGDRQYCIPLSSPKPKHQHMKSDRDFSKIVDKNGKLIGVLNFNNMIPVTESVLRPIDIVVRKGDDPQTRYYKGLLNDELDWCNDNRELVERKAAKLYRLITESPEKARSLAQRCCDFRKLETVLEAYRCQS